MQALLRASLVGLVIYLAACSEPYAPTLPPASFGRYVEAFTAGNISARSAILVRIAEGAPWKDTSSLQLDRILRIDPAVPGTVRWRDRRTLAFEPAERLAAGKDHLVQLDLGALLDVPPDVREMRYTVHTIAQGVRTEVSDLTGPASDRQQLVLTVRTLDDATGLDLPACFTATHNGKALTSHWTHAEDGRTHTLTIDDVVRGDIGGTVQLSYDGAPIGLDERMEQAIAIPALNVLALIASTTHDDGERYAELVFSDPLDGAQDLEGRLTLGNGPVRLHVNGNRVLVMPEDRLVGEQLVSVGRSVRSLRGTQLAADTVFTLDFAEREPAVRMVGDGTILPSSNAMVMPFDAVGLHHVEVRILRIASSNVPQFLQTNPLSGENELARVGQLVARHLVPLRTADAPDLGEWNRYHLDLGRYFEAEPGALYRVELSFRRQHSSLACAGGTSELPDLGWEEPFDVEQARHDGSIQEWYGYEHYPYWGWDELDPCGEDYYRSQAPQGRNLLASDLGLLAREAEDGSWHFAVADIVSTQPMAGVELRVLGPQHQLLATLRSNTEGMALLPTTAARPAVVVAQKGRQYGYLRLEPGAALSVSEFDVSGRQTQHGMKGFLYGERGVWRPGDTLHLAFMLEDAASAKEHPVVMQLFDPQGRPMQRLVADKGDHGLFRFSTATPPDAPTGLWNAQVQVGSARFERSVRIEAVRPNRLRVLLDPGPDRLPGPGPHDVQVSAEWLHGAVARDLRTTVTMTLAADRLAFKGYEQWNFEDISPRTNDEEVLVHEGRTSAEGRLTFPLSLPVNAGLPALVKADLVTRIFEPGGDASMDRTTVHIAPYDHYVGVRIPAASGAWGSYYTDTTYAVEIATLNAGGTPVGGRDLEVQVMKLDHSWWWDGAVGGSANYMSAAHSTVRQRVALTTDAKGRARFDLRIDRPDRGRMVLRVRDPESGHTSASLLHFDWPGWSGWARREDPKAASMLTFSADKERYRPGDEAVLTIPSAGVGRALITIASNDQVLSMRWVELNEQETRVSVPISADMAPNVYADVCLLQPHGGVRNDLPIRLHGVIPIFVEDPASRLTPTLALPATIRTGAPFEVKVRERSGAAMTYTLAIVDEGLLDLTRFRTPDPWSHFHAREALGIRSWDVYDDVIGAYGQQVQRILALGGSDDGGPVQGARAQRFVPVVRYVGPFSIAANGQGTHSFTLDNYVGSVRVMVVATNGSGAQGHAEHRVPVTKPLMVLASLPRQLAPSEMVDLPVTLFAMERAPGTVKVSVRTKGPLRLNGPSSQQLRMNATGEQLLRFGLQCGDTGGIARVIVTAENGSDRATTEIEIAVRDPATSTSELTQLLVGPGEEAAIEHTPLGLPGSNSATLEFSSMPPINLGERLKYLMDYPHGCLEQTVSRAFAQLYLDRIVDLSPSHRTQLGTQVADAIRRVGQLQRTDGSFNTWPGGDSYDGWSSAYAGHFLVEARRAGHTVQQRVVDRWVEHTRRSLREDRPTNASVPVNSVRNELEAYRLFILALAQRPENAAMNRLRERKDLGDQARHLLAGAYALNGRMDVAGMLMGAMVMNSTPSAAAPWTYGSPLRDDAITAHVLRLMGRRSASFTVLQRIAAALSSTSWHSTQSTAFALWSIAQEGTANGKGLHYTITHAGRSVEERSHRSMRTMTVEQADGPQRYTVHNHSELPLHVQLLRQGRQRSVDEQERFQGILVRVRYEDRDGRTLDPTRVEQGTDVFAVVDVQHDGQQPDLRNLALTQIFPNGWEIRPTRLEQDAAAVRTTDHQDFRDDRVLSYFDLPRGASRRIRVALNASFTGRFWMPGVMVEAMYDARVQARTKGSWVDVVPPGSDPVIP
ncbi:MAG: MG2 domain-containing protein [Flavobacteriales bacterium]